MLFSSTSAMASGTFKYRLPARIKSFIRPEFLSRIGGASGARYGRHQTGARGSVGSMPGDCARTHEGHMAQHNPATRVGVIMPARRRTGDIIAFPRRAIRPAAWTAARRILTWLPRSRYYLPPGFGRQPGP